VPLFQDEIDEVSNKRRFQKSARPFVVPTKSTLIPPPEGVALRAAFEATCFRGAVCEYYELNEGMRRSMRFLFFG
jgi:hypothetical protein